MWSMNATTMVQNYSNWSRIYRYHKLWKSYLSIKICIFLLMLAVGLEPSPKSWQLLVCDV